MAAPAEILLYGAVVKGSCSYCTSRTVNPRVL